MSLLMTDRSQLHDNYRSNPRIITRELISISQANMKSTFDFIKLILVIFVTIEVIRADADIRRDCRKQTGVSWKSLKKLKAGNFIQNDQKLKCYIKCFMRKNGIFDDKDVDIEKAVTHLPSSLQASSRKILQRCKKLENSGDLCDRAFQVSKCYFKEQPDVLKSVSIV